MLKKLTVAVVLLLSTVLAFAVDDPVALDVSLESGFDNHAVLGEPLALQTEFDVVAVGKVTVDKQLTEFEVFLAEHDRGSQHSVILRHTKLKWPNGDGYIAPDGGGSSNLYLT